MVAANSTPLYPVPAANDMLGLFTYLDTAIGHNGIFGYMLLIMVWGISFGGMKMYRTEQAVSGSCFITAVVATLMAGIGMISPFAPVIFGILAVVSIALYRD
jgi:hypothetical protein